MESLNNLGLICREKLQAAEADVRRLVEEKESALQGKRILEEELRQLQGTTGRLTEVNQIAKNHFCPKSLRGVGIE